MTTDDRADDILTAIVRNSAISAYWDRCLANLAILKTHDIKSWCRVHLTRILTNEQRFEEVLAKAAFHPNGFDVITLYRSEGAVDDAHAFRVRLHIWWPNHKRGEYGDIHNHAWDFCSTIITGEFESQEYIFDDVDGVLNDRSSYKKLWYSIDEKAVRPTGACKERCVDAVRYRAGDCYAFGHDRFHRVAPSDELVSTCIITGPYQRRGSLLVVSEERAALPVSTFNRTRLDRETLRRKLSEYIDIIG